MHKVYMLIIFYYIVINGMVLNEGLSHLDHQFQNFQMWQSNFLSKCWMMFVIYCEYHIHIYIYLYIYIYIYIYIYVFKMHIFTINIYDVKTMK